MLTQKIKIEADVRQGLIKEPTMETFGIIGMALGMTGFLFGMLAYALTARLQGRIERLESELEKLKAENTGNNPNALALGQKA
jgi:hypothetical protein